MNIDDFEKFIPDNILERGEDCYNNGLVENAAKDEYGIWTAEIEGSDLYDVAVAVLSNGKVASWECDCPYDYGDICKHVVALLCHIRDNYGAEAVTVGTQYKALELKELVDSIDEKTLKTFICEYAAIDPALEQMIQQRFLPPEIKSKLVDYGKVIRACFSANRGNASYNCYADSMIVATIVKDLDTHLATAQFLTKQGDYETAADILFHIMKEIGRNFEEYQDDNGDFGFTCREAAAMLEGLMDCEIPDNVKKMLEDRLSELMSISAFGDYNLAPIHHLLFKLSLITNDIEKALQILDNALKEEPDSFRTYSLVESKLTILQKNNRLVEREQVIDQYLYLPEIRRMRLNDLIDKKAYEESLKVINEGIVVAEKRGDIGTVAGWKQEKLNIYLTQKDTDNIISMAEDLFVNGGNSMNYYHILKKAVPKGMWTPYLDDLLVRTEKKLWQGLEKHIYANIFVEEKYWGRLLSLVEKEGPNALSWSYSLIEQYGHHLAPFYPQEVLDIYKRDLLNYADTSSKRSHYEHIARILKKIKKYPKGETTVQELLSHFRDVYKRRPAMMAELRDV